jgi:hypothetical protein
VTAQNGFAESFHARLRDEFLDAEMFASVLDAQVRLGVWRCYYNEGGLHSSLEYRTPAEFAARWGIESLKAPEAKGPIWTYKRGLTNHRAQEQSQRVFVLPWGQGREAEQTEFARSRHRGHPHEGTLTLYLQSVPFALLVSRQVFTNEDGSQGTLYLSTYLSTSDLSLTASSLRTLCQKRWSATCGKWAGKVEEYHKSLKSNAAFAKSPTKRVRTQSNHFFASIVAFVKLETCRCATRLNHFALKGKLYQAALASAFANFRSTRRLAPRPLSCSDCVR